VDGSKERGTRRARPASPSFFVIQSHRASPVQALWAA